MMVAIANHNRYSKNA